MKITLAKQTPPPPVELKPGMIVTLKDHPHGHPEGTGMYLLVKDDGGRHGYIDMTKCTYHSVGSTPIADVFNRYIPLQGPITISND